MERQLTYLQALREALMEEMRADPSVVVLGEDVRQSLRGITKGCLEEFGPERIWDTPISEAAFVGMGTGAAMAGLRPVIEFQIGTLLYVVMDQLANQVQKLALHDGWPGYDSGNLHRPRIRRTARSRRAALRSSLSAAYAMRPEGVDAGHATRCQSPIYGRDTGK